MNPQITNTLNQVKQHLLAEYRDQLQSLILFGSQARNDARPDSDIDLLVILKTPVNPVQEIKKNSAWISDLCLETDLLINCVYLSERNCPWHLTKIGCFSHFRSKDRSK